MSATTTLRPGIVGAAPGDAAAPPGGSRVRPLAALALLQIAAAAVYAHATASDAWIERMQALAGPAQLAVLATLYGLCLAIPFVPGLELGLLLMAVFGGPGILAAWLATLGGLNLAFAVGRLRPWGSTGRWLQARAGAVLFARGSRLPAAGHPVLARLHRRFAGHALWPCLAVAALLNLPGNALLGGGGGIALLCGATRFLPWQRFAITVALASAFVPVLVLLGVISLRALAV